MGMVLPRCLKPRSRTLCRTYGKAVGYDELRAVNNITVGNPETVIKKLTETIQRLNPG